MLSKKINQAFRSLSDEIILELSKDSLSEEDTEYYGELHTDLISLWEMYEDGKTKAASAVRATETARVEHLANDLPFSVASKIPFVKFDSCTVTIHIGGNDEA